MGLPAYRAMMKACYAFEQQGFVQYDMRTHNYGECVRYLESKGYIYSTDTGEYTVAFRINEKQASYVDPGYYCWCHLHVEANDE